MELIPLFLFLVTLYVRPQDWVPGMVGFPTGYVLIPLGIAIGIFNRLREPEHFQTPQTWLLPVYLVIMYLATLTSVGSGLAFDQFDLFSRRMLVFYMVIWSLTTPQRIGATIWMILILSAFLALQAVLQALTGESWGGVTPFPGYAEIRVRWYGDWDGPNVYGILFVIAFGFILEYIFGPHNLWVRLAATTFGMSYVVAVFFTNSRGAVLALACMVMFYFQNRFKSMFAIGITVAAIGGLFVLGPSRMGEVSSTESSAHERTWLWEQGLVLLQQNPALGVGRGQFKSRVDLGLIAHNNYVQNFTETGLLGFFCFISMLWFSFKGNVMLNNPRYNAPPQLVAFGHMMTASLVGYAAATFFVVMELDLLYFIFGLCASVYLVALRECPDLPKLSFSLKDLIGIIGTMTAIIFMIWLAAVKHIL